MAIPGKTCVAQVDMYTWMHRVTLDIICEAGQWLHISSQRAHSRVADHGSIWLQRWGRRRKAEREQRAMRRVPPSVGFGNASHPVADASLHVSSFAHLRTSTSLSDVLIL